MRRIITPAALAAGMLFSSQGSAARYLYSYVDLNGGSAAVISTSFINVGPGGAQKPVNCLPPEGALCLDESFGNTTDGAGQVTGLVYGSTVFSAEAGNSTGSFYDTYYRNAADSSDRARLTVTELNDTDVVYSYNSPYGGADFTIINSGFIQPGMSGGHLTANCRGDSRYCSIVDLTATNDGASLVFHPFGEGLTEFDFNYPTTAGQFLSSYHDDGSGISSIALLNVIGPVAAATAALPEPATWSMFIGGFGLVGLAMRRRKAAFLFA